MSYSGDTLKKEEGSTRESDEFEIRRIKEFREETEEGGSGEKGRKRKGTSYPIPKNLHLFDKMVKEKKNDTFGGFGRGESLDFLDFDVSGIGNEKSKLQMRKIGEACEGQKGGGDEGELGEEKGARWPETDNMKIFDSFVTTTTDRYQREPMPSLNGKEKFESLNSAFNFAMARSFFFNILTVLPSFIILVYALQLLSDDTALKMLREQYFLRQLSIHFLIMLGSVFEFWNDFCKPRIKNIFWRNFEIFKRKIIGLVLISFVVYLNLSVLYYKKYPLVHLETEFYSFFVALTCYNLFNSYLFGSVSKDIQDKKTDWAKITAKIFLRKNLTFLLNLGLSTILLAMSQLRLFLDTKARVEIHEDLTQNIITLLTTKDIIINAACFFLNTYSIIEVSRANYIQIYKSKFSDFFINFLNSFGAEQVLMIDNAELLFHNLESQSLVLDALVVIDQSNINLIDINSLVLYSSVNSKPVFFNLRNFEKIIFRRNFVKKVEFISSQFENILNHGQRRDKSRRDSFEMRSRGFLKVFEDFFNEIFSYENLLQFMFGYNSNVDDKTIELLSLVKYDLDGFEYYLKNLKFMTLSHNIQQTSAFLGIKDTLRVYDSSLKNLDFFLYKIKERIDRLDIRVKLFYSIPHIKERISKLQIMIKINLRFTSTSI